MRSDRGITTLDLLAGRLSLDFVNTVDPRWPGGTDFLRDYDDLLAWSRHAGALDARAAAALSRAAAADPRAARAVFARAVALREALYRVVLALTGGEDGQASAPDPDDLAIVAREHARAEAAGRLVAAGDGPSALAWSWPDRPLDLARPLWPIARSATDVLAREDARRLGICPHEDCGWIFYDDTRNRSRRWCDMAECGSREKAARLTARRRVARADGADGARPRRRSPADADRARPDGDPARQRPRADADGAHP